MYDAEGRLARTTDARGNETTCAYDERGRVVSVKDAHGNGDSTEYDSDGNVVSRTDREGKKVLFEYDAEGRPARTTDGNGNAIEQVYADYSTLSFIVRILLRSPFRPTRENKLSDVLEGIRLRPAGKKNPRDRRPVPGRGARNRVRIRSFRQPRLSDRP